MEKLDVTRVMLRMKFVAQRMADDHRTARLHQRLVAKHVEQIAEPGALDEHRIHDRIDVVRTDVGNAYDQYVGLSFDRHGILLKDPRQGLAMDAFGLARPHAGHAVWRGILMEHLPAQIVARGCPASSGNP